MEPDRAREAELVGLLERDVEEAELLELLRTCEGPGVERAQAAVRDELRDLLLRVGIGPGCPRRRS